MSGPFPDELTTMGSQMPEEVSPLHASVLDLYRDHFPPGVSGEVFFGQATVFLKDKVKSFLQVSAGLGKRLALRVDPGNLFHPGNVPAAFLFDDGCEFPGLWKRF